MSNKRMIGVLLLAMTLLTGVGCATAQNKMTADDATQAITAAMAAKKKAASVSGEWRDTGKMIKAAEKAAKEGDYAKAVKLANKAKLQGERGYEQMVAQKELRMPSYFK